MEGISARVYRGLRSYWRRRRYERLNGPPRPGRRKIRAELAHNNGPDTSPSRRIHRKRFWRLRVRPRIRVGSPMKWLRKLRDGYVKMMLNFANSGVFGGSLGVEYGGGLGLGQVKEYDERLIVEIYKSLVMAQGQMVPRDAAKLSSHIVSCGR